MSNDKANWTKISGFFIANGSENYLLIGNFNRKQATTTTQVSSTNTNYSYYYIDDVCVSSDSLTCSQPVGINPTSLNLSSFNLYPNPATSHVTISNNLHTAFDIQVYNTVGQLLYKEQNINKSNLQLDVSSYNSGLLFIKITSNNNQFIYKHLKH